jgi:hypothetical protein
MPKDKERLNVNVLVTARNEYTEQLKDFLSPLLLEGFIAIYEDAVKIQDEEGTYQYIKQFQLFLRDIPKWNQTILVDETNRILEKIPYLQKLLMAIFVSHVKILSSIKLGGSHKNIQITIPPSDILIHKLYITCAQEIYKNENILLSFRDYSNRDSNNLLISLIKDVIDKTLKTFIPIQVILEEYLNNVFINDVMRTGNEEDDSEEEMDKIEDSYRRDDDYGGNNDNNESGYSGNNESGYDGTNENEYGGNNDGMTSDGMTSDGISGDIPSFSNDQENAPIMKISENFTGFIDPSESNQKEDKKEVSFFDEPVIDFNNEQKDPLSTDPLSTDPLSSDPLSTDPLSTDPLSTDPFSTETNSSNDNSFKPDIKIDTNFESGEDLFKVGNTGLSPLGSSDPSFF